MKRALLLASVSLLAACGDSAPGAGALPDAAAPAVDGPGPAPADGPRPDAPMNMVPDAGPVADAFIPPPDAPPPPACTGCPDQKMVVNSLHVPETPQESTSMTYGCDIVGGGPGIDNALGGITSFLASQSSMPLNATIGNAVQNGSILVLMRMAAPSLTTAGPNQARLELRLGQKPAMWDAMVAFSGMGMFGIDPSWAGSEMGGSIMTSQAAFGPGTLRIPLLISTTIPQVNLDVVDAHVTGTVSASGIMTGKICGVIPQATIENEIAPKLAVVINGVIQQGGSTAETICNLVDTDESCGMDCRNDPPTSDCVTGREILDSPLIGSLLKPDIDFNGVKGLSMGLGFTAVGAVF